MTPSHDLSQQFPSDATGEVLRSMHADGVDFTRDHDVEFVLTFDKMEDAERRARAVAGLKHFDVRVLANGDTEGADLIATRRMRLTHAGITATEDQLDGLARTYNGVADGWGTLQH